MKRGAGLPPASLAQARRRGLEREIERLLSKLRKSRAIAQLPAPLYESRIAAEVAAQIEWERAHLHRRSASELADLAAQRAQEVEQELRAGPWGHALRAAIDGDASRLALLLTRGRVPPELADLVYGVILAAPWRNRQRGRQSRLNAVDKIGAINLLALKRAFDGRPREVVLDELAHRFGVSRATLERALQEQSARTRTNGRFVRARRA